MSQNFNTILRQLVNAGMDIAAESIALKMKARPELSKFAMLPASIVENMKQMHIGQLPAIGTSSGPMPEPATMRQWIQAGAQFISEQSGYAYDDILNSRQVREIAIHAAANRLHPDHGGDAEQLARLMSIARVMRALDEIR